MYMKRFVITASLVAIVAALHFIPIAAPLGADFIYTAPAAAEETTTGLPNPLGKLTDPREIIGNVIKAMLGVTGSLALLVFIFGGFTWVTSAGNEEKIKKGKEMILWAALGLVVIFASYAMVRFVIGAATGGANTTGGQQGEQVET